MESPATLGEAWRHASRHIDRLDARRLIELVTGCTHTDLIAHPERLLPTESVDQLNVLIARRAAGEPLSYLLGSAYFHDLEFVVSPAVLIPRPETELLVDLALERAQRLATPRILDLGTGSGIVAVTLANLCPFAEVTAVDASPKALEIARSNAKRHAPTVRLLTGDWYTPVAAERFDLVVSNPPYVVLGDPHLNADGLPFEPQMALTDGIAGGDGLACIRAIVHGAQARLADDGWLLIEHGYDQAKSVRALMTASGLTEVATWQDFSGIDRVSGGRKA